MVSITQFQRSVTESNVCFLWGHSTVFRPLRNLHSELFGVGYLEIYAT